MAGGSGRGHEHPIPETPRPRRHCWVRGPADAPGPHPGLVIGWEKREGTWFAHVAYFLEGDHALIQQWLASDYVSPVHR